MASWEESSEVYHELEDTFALTDSSSLQDSINNIISFLGMQPADRSEKVPEGKSSHTLFLAGKQILEFFYLFDSVQKNILSKF